MTTPPIDKPMRSRRTPRCEGCGLPIELCLCAAIPRVARDRAPIELVLIAHHREWRRSSNTGRLLLRALEGARVIVRGERDGALQRPSPAEAPRRLVLFPTDDARPLTPDDARDRVLVVPEGSWAQTHRALKREPWLLDAERVRLPQGAPSRYQLRVAPREEGLSTFEAVARALGVLVGPPVEAELMAVFDAFVARSLTVRGRRSG